MTGSRAMSPLSETVFDIYVPARCRASTFSPRHGVVTPCLQSTSGLSERVAHLGLRQRGISQDRWMSDLVVVNLGGQLSGTRHQATCLGRTARCGLSLQPFRYRERGPVARRDQDRCDHRQCRLSHVAQAASSPAVWPPQREHLIRRNLHALLGPVRTFANLRGHAHHLASFVAVERPRKAKVRPASPIAPSAWELDSHASLTSALQPMGC